MKNIKTLWQIFLDALNESEKYYSIYDFLNKADEKISEKVMDIDQRQFEKYMWEFDFKSHDEVVRAIIKYHEHVIQRDIDMGEMWDIEDWADDYMTRINRTLNELIDSIDKNAGDLSIRVNHHSNDELGQILTNKLDEAIKKDEMKWELRKDILDTNE